jgi:hypothetical protein
MVKIDGRDHHGGQHRAVILATRSRPLVEIVEVPVPQWVGAIMAKLANRRGRDVAGTLAAEISSTKRIDHAATWQNLTV